MKQIHRLADEFRAEAAVMRAWGWTAAAEGAETAASRIEAALREWESEALSVADAASESGYSIAHLRRLVTSTFLRDVPGVIQVVASIRPLIKRHSR